MATLNEVMKETADDIREKTGKSELIAPVNFAEEIKSISAGGSAEGASTIEYLDVRESDDKETLIMYSLCVKLQDSVATAIFPASVAIDYTDAIEAVAILPDVKMADMSNPIGEMITVRELFGEEYLASIPHLTKEEFYKLD